jgi:aldose 1-epimerase
MFLWSPIHFRFSELKSINQKNLANMYRYMPSFSQTLLIGIFIFVAVIMFSCGPKANENSSKNSENNALPMVTSQPWGEFNGQPVSLYTMRNANGMEVRVMNYGGIIVSINVPDKNGVIDDVALGYDSLSHYVKSNPFFGALIGRYGNRIAEGKFTLDGKTYTLPTNNGVNHLHGGTTGFDKVFWEIEDVSDSTQVILKLSYTSADGEQGYPGTLTAEVLYTLTPNNELKFDYKATADKKTIVNLTQHTYFNLSGQKSATDILSHTLTMAADKYLPVDETLIPTGELQPVAGTPFNFLKPQTIGARINDSNQQLKFGKGYDHCWVLNKQDASLSLVATLADSVSGRTMDVLTTEPALQFYSGNFLDGSNIGKGNSPYQFRTGLCLETQHFPDSPNKPKFPSVVLNPGEVYTSQTVYRFGLIK